jgi:RimJ/RimL family protein N-acetyltransferase
MQILETDRLLLRHLVPDDLDALYALYRDPEMRRYFPVEGVSPDRTLTREETWEELEWSKRTARSSAAVACCRGRLRGRTRSKSPT